MTNQKQLVWGAFEHEHVHKGGDWFWALGIIAIAGAIVSVIFSNILFAIVILIGAFVLGMNVYKGPEYVNFEINERGIAINKTLHLYSSIRSFWVEEDEHSRPKILLTSNKTFALHIVIPIEGPTPSQVRDYLRQYIEEEEDSESLAQKIVEFFGF